ERRAAISKPKSLRTSLPYPARARSVPFFSRVGMALAASIVAEKKGTRHAQLCHRLFHHRPARRVLRVLRLGVDRGVDRKGAVRRLPRGGGAFARAWTPDRHLTTSENGERNRRRRAKSLLVETDDVFWRAMQSRDRRFEGRFVAGVLSTRIYC